MHEVITGYFQHPDQTTIHARVPVGITPCGTANAMAWELHTHPVRTKIAVVGRATLAVAKGKSRKVDVIKCTQDPQFLGVRETKKVKKSKKLEQAASVEGAGVVAGADSGAGAGAAVADGADSGAGADDGTGGADANADADGGAAADENPDAADDVQEVPEGEDAAEHGANGDVVLELGLVGQQIPTKAGSASKSKGSKNRKEMLNAKRSGSAGGGGSGSGGGGGGGAAAEGVIAIDHGDGVDTTAGSGSGADTRPNEEGTAEENAAAIKIQANFRGHLHRKHSQEQQEQLKAAKKKRTKGALGTYLDDDGGGGGGGGGGVDANSINTSANYSDPSTPLETYALSCFGWGLAGAVALKADKLRWIPGQCDTSV